MSNWFIAFPVAADALPARTLAGLPAGTRAMHRDDLHVTLAFLGPVGENRAARAWARIESLAGTPLRTHAGSRAALGPGRRPSALALDLDRAPGDGALTRFIAHWRGELCTAAGAGVERREVRPHVTLGRPPRHPGADWKRALSAWLAQPDVPSSMLLDTVALYTRAEPGDERRFQCVARCHWGDRGPGGDAS